MFKQFLANTRMGLSMFKLSHRDLWFLAIALALAWALFWPDVSNMQIVKVVAGFFVAVAVISHIGRRLMLPYIDLREYVKKASETPMSAAIVFLGVCIILVAMIFTAGGFFH